MAGKTGTISGAYIEKVGLNQRTLILTGVWGPIVFVLNVVLGGIITPNHSHIRNAVSELTQRGAPNIVLLSALFVLSAVLILIFGATLMRSYWHRSKRAFAGATLIVVYGVFAVLLATVFPQDPLGGEATFPGTMHLILAGLAALVIMSAIVLIGLGLSQHTGYGRGFKAYSLATVLVMLIFGASTPVLIANGIELVGLFQRITQLAYLQWFVVCALKRHIEPTS